MASPSYILVTFLLLSIRLSEAALRTYNFTLHSGTKAPDGFTREVYLINGQLPGPLIDIDEGDDLEVFVQNDLTVETTIHWHGLLQRGTPQMDGVPGVSQYPIAPGGNFTYKFSVGSEYGFYWYHSHFRAYYDDAIRGPLIIRPSPSRTRPFEKLAANKDDLANLLNAEHDATPVLLNDWTHALSDTIYTQYFKTGAFPNCADSLLANGNGRVECLPDYILKAGTALGLDAASTQGSASSKTSMAASSMTMSGMKKRMDMGASSMSTDAAMNNMPMGGVSSQPTPTSSMSDGSAMPSMSPMSGMDTMSGMSATSGMSSMASMAPMGGMQGMGSLNARGCTPPMMFKPGFNVGSLPPETCANTTSSQLTIQANSTQGWLALNLVNAGAVSKLAVSLDAHSMYIYAADGLFVTLQKVEVLYLALGQRYSVMIELNQTPGDYYLRFAAYPTGDMQQVIEGQAIVSYKMNYMKPKRAMAMQDNSTSTWMLVNGSAVTDASTLDASRLQPFQATPPPAGKADITTALNISQTDIVSWVMNGNPYSEASTPVLYGNASDGWNANTTLHLPFNSTVDIIMAVAKDSMDTMGHPMHLHGHKFWVLGSGSGQFPYASAAAAPSSAINLRDPPYRDSAELPAAGWLAIRYVTDNPGAWLFHCHVQWHILSGMALVLVEGEEKLPGIFPGTKITSETKTSYAGSNTSRNHIGRMVKSTGHLGVVPLVAAISAALI